MNNEVKFPKFIAIILDCELIELCEIFDWGVSEILKGSVGWLRENISFNIESRKEDLLTKNPGALFAKDEPKLIWVEAIHRPNNSARKEIYSLVTKYNGILKEEVSKLSNGMVMKIESVKDLNCFDASGHLTPIGKEKFWKEFLHNIAKLNNEISSSNNEQNTSRSSQGSQRPAPVRQDNFGNHRPPQPANQGNEQQVIWNKSGHQIQRDYDNYNRKRHQDNYRHRDDYNRYDHRQRKSPNKRQWSSSSPSYNQCRRDHRHWSLTIWTLI